MKDFILGLFELSLRIVMSIPFHCVRIAYLRMFIGKIGKNVSISRNVEFRNIKHVYIENNVVINKRCLLDARGGKVVIKNNVDMAQDTYVWTLQHDYNNSEHCGKGANVIIEDHAWIGARSNILPGVVIGRGAVVGSCSVVTKNICEKTVVAGNPAKVINKRYNDLDYTLFHRMWFD